MSRPLSLDLSSDDVRPYFLWSEDASVGELRARLAGATGAAWASLVGMVMREARDPDVWRFVTPAEVSARFDEIRPFLGRRRPFWDYLIEAWRRDGYVD